MVGAIVSVERVVGSVGSTGGSIGLTGDSGDCDLGVTGRDDIDEMDGDNGSGFLRNRPVALSLSCAEFPGTFCLSNAVSSNVNLASLAILSTCCSNPLSSPRWRLLV